MLSIGCRLAPPLAGASVALTSMRRFYNVMRLTIARFGSRLRRRVSQLLATVQLLLFLADNLYLVVETAVWLRVERRRCNNWILE